jgi:hypothetical protein
MAVDLMVTYIMIKFSASDDESENDNSGEDREMYRNLREMRELQLMRENSDRHHAKLDETKDAPKEPRESEKKSHGLFVKSEEALKEAAKESRELREPKETKETRETKREPRDADKISAKSESASHKTDKKSSKKESEVQLPVYMGNTA